MQLGKLIMSAFLHALSMLQQLIFELHSEINDVCFFLELLDHRISMEADMHNTQDAQPSPATTRVTMSTLPPPTQD
jgi:hypothetical protein